MASPGNQYCAKCIGTLQFPIVLCVNCRLPWTGPFVRTSTGAIDFSTSLGSREVPMVTTGCRSLAMFTPSSGLILRKSRFVDVLATGVQEYDIRHTSLYL